MEMSEEKLMHENEVETGNGWLKVVQVYVPAETAD